MIIRGVKQLVEEANAAIETLSVDGGDDADALLQDENVQLVDIRDVRELDREGTIPGAFHAPRGMLEFWVDPKSPYHKEVFASGKKFVFYCASAWRSALATKAVQDMGLGPVAHLEGGFTKWRERGYPIAERAKK
jgi:rhodanese-related sulfurtransferase